MRLIAGLLISQISFTILLMVRPYKLRSDFQLASLSQVRARTISLRSCAEAQKFMMFCPASAESVALIGTRDGKNGQLSASQRAFQRL
eukprot:5685869-Pleurochrysis_carterae.AAC.1